MPDTVKLSETMKTIFELNMKFALISTSGIQV